MPKKRLPAIIPVADRAVAKERAGIRWDRLVEKVGKDKGGSEIT